MYGALRPVDEVTSTAGTTPDSCGLCGQTRAEFDQEIAVFRGGYAHVGCADDRVWDESEDYCEED